MNNTSTDIISQIQALGYTKVECISVNSWRDLYSFNKSVRTTAQHIDCCGVYVFIGIDCNGDLVPIYIGSSKLIRNRIVRNQIAYRSVLYGEYTNISVYYNHVDNYASEEAAMIRRFIPAFNTIFTGRNYNSSFNNSLVTA